jgi:hypothetical protein
MVTAAPPTWESTQLSASFPLVDQVPDVARRMRLDTVTSEILHLLPEHDYLVTQLTGRKAHEFGNERRTLLRHGTPRFVAIDWS